MPTYRPLVPYHWPQDALQIPAGIGGMPHVSRGNREVARAEYAAYSANFTLPALQAAGAVASTFIATDQDGDFWCDQIGVVSWVYLGASKGLLQMPGCDMAVKDARTGRSLFYPGFVPAVLFRKLSNFPVALTTSGQEPIPTGLRQTGTLVQPFCFTRQGGIQLDLSFPSAVPAATSYQVTFMFSGWKEYANASK